MAATAETMQNFEVDKYKNRCVSLVEIGINGIIRCTKIDNVTRFSGLDLVMAVNGQNNNDAGAQYILQ
jgi:hypothetical protein